MTILSLFKNDAFDPEVTSLLASAFESAWERIQMSGSPLGADGQAPATRELLAKRIIERAQEGERDRQRLVEDAVAYIAIAR